MQINDLSAKATKFTDQIKAATDRVISSGWFVLGPEVKQFEQSFADYLGAGHCVSVANGTDAIELALKSVGIQTTDRVATVANAGMYTTTAIMGLGSEPYFIDVDINTRGATLEEVKRAIGDGVKAVVVTHLFGLAIPEIQQIAKYCKQKSIPLLEDCAQAHGAKVNGSFVGTFGDIATFSFYPTKNLGALGDGGAVVTNNPKLAEKVRYLRQYGWIEKYKVNYLGARNSRLDEIQAAILSEMLPYLDESNSRRREIAARYSALITHVLVEVPAQMGTEYVAHLYVVRCQKREAMREHLMTLNISTDIHYPIPDYRQPVFETCYASTGLENTDSLAGDIVTLPCYPEMSDEEVDQVITAVNSWPV